MPLDFMSYEYFHAPSSMYLTSASAASSFSDSGSRFQISYPFAYIVAPPLPGPGALGMCTNVNVPGVSNAEPSVCHEHGPKSGHWTPLTELLTGLPNLLSTSNDGSLEPNTAISGHPGTISSARKPCAVAGTTGSFAPSNGASFCASSTWRAGSRLCFLKSTSWNRWIASASVSRNSGDVATGSSSATPVMSAPHPRCGSSFVNVTTVLPLPAESGTLTSVSPSAQPSRCDGQAALVPS
mmetsp:Transcript_7406/g.30648  ORF Transcript_7406/g.30648 Transcript_7406/m.30648 type:complete len:239 (+) Transcript_7406:1620-2336(+)